MIKDFIRFHFNIIKRYEAPYKITSHHFHKARESIRMPRPNIRQMPQNHKSKVITSNPQDWPALISKKFVHV